MARKARRDCRKAESKKNHLNGRVEKQQKEIRIAKKEAAKAGAGGAASSKAAPAAPSSLTTKAADFLAQMRADVAAELPKLGGKTADGKKSAST